MTKTKIFTRTIVILSLVSLFNDISSEMLIPILPIYLSSIGFSALYIGVLEGFAEVVVGLSKGYFGNLSDVTGNRIGFVRWGYSLSAVSKSLIGLFTFPLWVFAARTGDKLGKGIRTNARDALLADDSQEQHRGKVFGFHRALDTTGAAIGPVLALVYLSFFPSSYRNLFFISFIPAALAVLLTWKIHQPVVIKKGIDASKKFFSYFSYWKKSTLQYKRIILGFLLLALFNSSDAFIILIGKHHGLGDTTIILAYIFFNLVYASFSIPMGKLADRKGMKFSFVIGISAFIIAYAFLPFANTALLFFTAFFIYGISASANEGISKAWISLSCSPEDKATALGFFSSIQSFVICISSTLAGLIWMKINPAAVFLFSASGGLVVLLYVLFTKQPARTINS